MTPTPTYNTRLTFRRADFRCLPDALDYAAKGETGFNFYSARAELVSSLPYALLRERAVAMARGLIQAGFEPEQRVVLLGDTDPEIITAFFACQYAALIPVVVPIPASLGGREAYIEQLGRLLTSADAKVAMAPSAYLGFLEEAAGNLNSGLMTGTPADFAELPGHAVDIRPFGPDDACYFQYSSGSTRWPLGVEVPQRCLMANAHGMAAHGLDARPGDRGISWLPLYHDMGLVGFLLTPVLCQLSNDYLATRDFARRSLTWLKLIGENGCSLSYSPTFGYDLCCRRAENAASQSFDLGTWRAAGIGGDMIQPQVMERFAEVFQQHGFDRKAFVASYGMAEATLAVSFAPLNRGLDVDLIDRQRFTDEHVALPDDGAPAKEKPRGFVFCGPALPGHVIEIRAEDGTVLSDRHVGRIFVKGPSIAKGYFGEPEISAEVFKDGWLDTGDLGYLVDDEVVITGRSKDLMIINGRNIWPQDVEWAVEELPGLRRGDVAMFSIEDLEHEPEVVILVQCRSRDNAHREQLIKDVKATASRTAAVDGVVLLVPPHSLPMTSSGKLSRARAKQNYLDGLYTEADEASAGRPLAMAAGD
ncbi:MAG: fatty acyl-AMP ligase [Alphaproteobacteria bacterium]|nr:fatty acyl-AMP ligase [Alphaproteobacteria bacterium]